MLAEVIVSERTQLEGHLNTQKSTVVDPLGGTSKGLKIQTGLGGNIKLLKILFPRPKTELLQEYNVVVQLINPYPKAEAK